MKTIPRFIKSFRDNGFHATAPGLGLVLILSLLFGFAGRTMSQSLSALIPVGATWAYLDNGSDPGESWRDLSFDDSNWLRGQAELGYGDGDEATVVRRGDNVGNIFVTTYFRRTFSVADPSALTNVVARYQYDDGIVAYLNGVEVFRSNMPTGMVRSLTYALAPIEGTNEAVFTSAAINSSVLKAGQNVLAVEVHQFQDGGNDLSFDLALEAETVATNMPPQISQQPANLASLVGGSASFKVMVDGTPPLNYQWKRDGMVLPGSTVWELTLNNVQLSDAGKYSVVIVNGAGMTESAPATLTVYGPPMSVSGRVTDPSGRPVDGVKVVITGPTRQSVLTDPDGTYSFRGLRYGGAYSLGVGDTNVAATPMAMNLSPLTNTASVNFTVATPYQAWEQQYWGGNGPQALSAPSADADGDGKPNLIEFAMGSNPLQPDSESGISLRMVNVNGTTHPVIHLKLSPQARDLGIGVEVSTNLAQSAWIRLCERSCKPIGGESEPPGWGPGQAIWDAPKAEQYIETPDGVDIHLSPIPAGVPSLFVRWSAAPPIVPAPVVIGVPPDRKNKALLVGFNNFQRMPIYVRDLFDTAGNPLGYLSDKVAARRFATRVIQGNYDVIGLAEVWTDDAKNWLEHDLKPYYPYYVKQLDVRLDALAAFGKFQDSGLMLFSKLPFTDLPHGPATAPAGDTAEELVLRAIFSEGIVASTGGSPLDKVGFMEFHGDYRDDASSSGIDSLSNKGAGMVRVHDPKADRDYTVVFTHLNGPQEGGDDEIARRTQLVLIKNMLIGHFGEPPFANSVLVLGDFNINGDMRERHGRPEWTLHFGSDEAWWGHNFKDTWEEQSHQEPVSMNWRDQGLTCSPLSPGSRYDYLFTHQGQANSLVVQHMAQALNLRFPLSAPGEARFEESKVAFGTAGNQDLSDHFGIVAYIHPDLSPSLAGQTPASAIVVSGMSTGSADSAVETEGAISVPGQFQWFVLPQPGTYSISVEPSADVMYDVFSSQDLSQQIMDTGSYRWLEYGSPPTKTRALTFTSPFQPLFIRVQHKNPELTGSFKLVVRKHQGATREDAIPLAPNAEQLHTNDISGAIGTPERWFIIATETAPSKQLQQLIFKGAPLVDGDAINHVMELQSDDGTVLRHWSVTADPATYEHPEMWRTDTADTMYLRVVPDPGAAVKSLRLGWSTDLTVMVGAGVPLAQFGIASTNVTAANLIITEGTDSGIAEDEESIKMSWVLSSDPAVMDRSSAIRHTDATIAEHLEPILVAREIAVGQSAVASFVFPELHFLPNEYLEVQCTEWDDATYSLLKGRVWPLDRAMFIAPQHTTHVMAREDRTEYYTLTKSLVHGIRWCSYGHH